MNKELVQKVLFRLKESFEEEAVCHCGGALKDHSYTENHSFAWNPDKYTQLISDAEFVIKRFVEETERLQEWVHNLQSNRYINCVYCGYMFGPAESADCRMSDKLKKHMETCEHHPLSGAMKRIAELENKLQGDDNAVSKS